MWYFKTVDLLKQVQFTWPFLWQDKKSSPFNTGGCLTEVIAFNSPVSCLPSTTSVRIVVFFSFLCVFLCFYLFCFFVLFVFVLCLVFPILAVFLDCLFLIALSVFSNVYLLVVYLHFYIMSWLLVHHQGMALWKSFSSESTIFFYTNIFFLFLSVLELRKSISNLFTQPYKWNTTKVGVAYNLLL
jgi:hypothetical protein